MSQRPATGRERDRRDLSRTARIARSRQSAKLLEPRRHIPFVAVAARLVVLRADAARPEDTAARPRRSRRRGRSLYPLAVPEALGARVVRVPQGFGTRPIFPARTSAIAASSAWYDAFDFGAVARYTTASASGMRPSGIPMSCTASAAGDGDAERLRVGHPDVLGGADDDAPSDEARVLPASIMRAR